MNNITLLTDQVELLTREIAQEEANISVITAQHQQRVDTLNVALTSAKAALAHAQSLVTPVVPAQ